MPGTAVVGLGLMGTALARLLVAAVHPVTVWNPTPRLDAVPGARVAGHLSAAIAVSGTILICLRDIAVTRVLFDGATLVGKVVVNLSSGSPSDAERMAARMAGQGAAFVDGAVMNNPEQAGGPGSRILLAGDAAVQVRVAPLMACLAADIRNVGPNCRAAKAMYQAYEMVYFGHLAASLHAADICLSEGIDLAHLHALHGADPTHQGFIQTLIDGHYHPNNQTLQTWANDLNLIRKQAAEAGIASPFPDLLAGFFDRAIAAGHGQDDVMAIWKTLT